MLSRQGAGTTGTITGGTTVAVPGKVEVRALGGEVVQLFDEQRSAAAVAEGDSCRLVEVAVVEKSLPVHTDQGATHDVRSGFRVEPAFQKLQIPFHGAALLQLFAKTSDGGIGDGVEIVEADAVTFGKFHPIGVFQLSLGAGQKCSMGIVNQVELMGIAIPQPVQLLQGSDAGIIDSSPSLAVDVFLKVAGEGCHDDEILVVTEAGEPLHPLFHHD